MSTEDARIIREKFAQRLTAEIGERGWNQSDLAREASKHLPSGEIARDNISNYCNAKALNTTADDLLPERGAPPARDRGMLPATDVRDAGEGQAFLRINRRVPWPIAVKILEVLNEQRLKDMNADHG